MLTNSLKISDTTKTEFFQWNFYQSDQKIWLKYWRADLSSVLEPLTRWLRKSVVTRGFLVISVTPLFAAYNFTKKKTSDSHLFFQSIENFMYLSEMEKEIQKIFFGF